MWSYTDVAKMIDHSILGPDKTLEDFREGVRIARTYAVASVCVPPFILATCKSMLEGSCVLSSTTIGFPHGGQTTSIKLAEAKQALDDGADELDAVVNISQVKSGAFDPVRAEIAALSELTHASGKKLKLIFENAYLNESEKLALCAICVDLKVDWVKTSTGYAPSGSTSEDLRLMRQAVGTLVQVKAAGGIRNLDALLLARDLGATRVGTSATEVILEEARLRLGLPSRHEVLSGEAAPSSDY